MLNPAAALCSLFTGHMIQTLLKIVRLLCITISVGRSRSVKNVADTKLFAARSLQKARFSRPTSTATHKRRPQNQDSLNSAARFLPFVKIGVR